MITRILDFREVNHPVEGRIVDMHFPNRFPLAAATTICRDRSRAGDSVAILREIAYNDNAIEEIVKSKATWASAGRHCTGPRVLRIALSLPSAASGKSREGARHR